MWCFKSSQYYYMIELKLSSIGNKEVIGIHWHDEGACGMFLSWEVMVFVWDVTVSNSKADIIPVYLFVPSLNPNHGVKLSRNTLQDIHIIAAALILLMNRNLICNVAPTLRTGPSIVRRLRPEIRQQKQPKPNFPGYNRLNMWPGRTYSSIHGDTHCSL